MASFPMRLGTAVSMIEAGEGRIVVSTPDLVEHLSSEEGPAQVARKLLCNYIQFAATLAPSGTRLPLAAQNKLLKAIDEKQVKRLGTNHYKLCDVQVIAATSRVLPHMVQSGSFREDLYCRLAVLTIETTPLRDRREDIPEMIALFLREAAETVAPGDNPSVYRIEDNAIDILCEFHYPGNIRSLEQRDVRSGGEKGTLHLCARFINDLAQREGHCLQILNQPFVSVRREGVDQPITEWPGIFSRHGESSIY